MTPDALEDVWRRESPHVLGALLRQHGNLADCEDAAQEALLAAAQQWPDEGRPDNPRAWLIRVAGRRLTDQFRSDASRRRREMLDAGAQRLDSPVESEPVPDRDDSLQLLMLCCHPALSRASQVALSLRCVAGLDTEQIAAAYLVPASTMAQRLSRARTALREAGAKFSFPAPEQLPHGVAAVLDVCHLIFNEGYTRSSGAELHSPELAQEAIRLVRMLRAALPDHDEAAGLLALLLLTHARSAARIDSAGDLVPLEHQDRSQWDRKLIAEGVALLEAVLPRGHVGRYQLQASIAAVHAEAASWQETDWLQINLLYGMLDSIAPSPAVTLNRAVATAMVLGPDAGIAIVEKLLADPVLRKHHRTHAVLAHLFDAAGNRPAAVEHFALAAQLTRSQAEQRYLNRKLSALKAQQAP